MSEAKVGKDGAELVSTAAIATALNLSSRHVNALAQDGVLPRAGARNSFDLLACLLAYVRYLQRALAVKGTMDADGTVTVASRQRGALLDVDLARARLKLAKEQGEAVSITDFESYYSDLVIETRSRLRAVPSRVAGKIVAGMSRATIQQVISAGVDEALHDLATGEPKRPDGTPWGARAPAKKRAAKTPASKKPGPKKQAPVELPPDSPPVR
jgi:phage terminase Nu1 subunit (DNA packaging protein)